jgi:hypothetical protein
MSFGGYGAGPLNWCGTLPQAKRCAESKMGPTGVVFTAIDLSNLPF